MTYALRPIFVIQLSIALVVSLPASGDPRPAPEKGGSPDAKWGKPVGGQAISIAAERTVYAPGAPVLLTVVFKNVGQQDVRIIERNLLATYRIRVLLPSGTGAPLTLFGKTRYANCSDGSASVSFLKPGEQERARFAISRLFDLSLAGKYTVFVQRHVWTPGNNTSTTEVTSNRLELAIDDTLGEPIQESVGGH